jgi:YD repeat-containing protein
VSLYYLAACGSDNTTGPQIGSIEVDPAAVILAQLDSTLLRVSVLDTDGHPMTNVSVEFTSSDTARVKVSSAGMVVSRGGTGRLTVMVRASGGTTAYVPVEVITKPTSIQVTPNPATLQQLGYLQLHAAVLDALGDTIAGAPITFQSNDGVIATVSAGGLVHAVGPLGSVGIELTSPGISDTFPVTVIAAQHPLIQIVHTSPTEGNGYGVDISGAGIVYVAQNDGFVSRADLPSYTMNTLDSGRAQPSAVVFNPAGTLAYVTGALLDGLMVYRTSDNAAVDSVTVLDGQTFDVKLSQNGGTIYVATGAGHVYAIDATTLNVIHQFDRADPIIHLAVDPVNGHVFASGYNEVDELDGATLVKQRAFTRDGLVQAVAVSSDGKTLYQANEDGHFQTINLVTGFNGPSIPTCGGYGLVVSQDGLVAFMSCPLASKVEMIDLGQMTVVGEINTGGTPRRMAFDASGLLLAITNGGGWVDFIN